MRMPAHVHHVSHEQVADVIGMKRLYLRVLGAREIVDFIALNGLIQKRQTKRKNECRDDQRALNHFIGRPSPILANSGIVTGKCPEPGISPSSAFTAESSDGKVVLYVATLAAAFGSSESR